MTVAPTGPISGRFELPDRVAVVTGATSELGLSVTRALGAAGARIALAGRQLAAVEDRCTLLRSSQGIEIAPFVVDVADADACSRADGEIAAAGAVSGQPGGVLYFRGGIARRRWCSDHVIGTVRRANSSSCKCSSTAGLTRSRA
jgi:NAD(P)-dependent dehydrogenase (short-subunit alcohol dehydrogenase family)